MKALAFWLFLAATAQAGIVYADLAFDQLTLKNGKTLQKVVIKSFNDVSGNVTLQVGNSLQNVPMAMLPPEIAAQLKAMAPELTPEEKARLHKDEAAKERKIERERAARERRALAKEKADTDAARRLWEKSADRADKHKYDTPALVMNAAQTRANGYFGGRRIEYEDPEAVPGWPNRWRVKGTVFGSSTTGRYTGTNRTSRTFEILVETRAKGSPKVIEIIEGL